MANGGLSECELFKAVDTVVDYANRNHLSQDLVENLMIKRRLDNAETTMGWQDGRTAAACGRTDRWVGMMKKEPVVRDAEVNVRRFVEALKYPEPMALLIAATGAGPKRESELIRLLLEAGYTPTAAALAMIKQAVHDRFIRRINHRSDKRETEYVQTNNSYLSPEPKSRNERIFRQGLVVAALEGVNGNSPFVKATASLTRAGFERMQNYLSTKNKTSPIIEAVNKREKESQEGRGFASTTVSYTHLTLPTIYSV